MTKRKKLGLASLTSLVVTIAVIILITHGPDIQTREEKGFMYIILLSTGGVFCTSGLGYLCWVLADWGNRIKTRLKDNAGK